MRNLNALALEETREIKGSGRHLATLHLETSRLEGDFDVGFVVEVGARRLGRTREQLADALENEVGERLWREGDDELLGAQAGQVVDHAVDAILRVVNHDVDAGDHVVLAGALLETHGVKLGRLFRRLGTARDEFVVTTLRFAHHGRRNVARSHVRPLERQRNGQRSGTATRVAHRHASQILALHPVQNLIHSLLMSGTNIELHLVHIIRLTVNLIPPLKPSRVKVILHRSGFVATRFRHHALPSLARVRQHERRARAGENNRTSDRESRAIGNLRDLTRVRRRALRRERDGCAGGCDRLIHRRHRTRRDRSRASRRRRLGRRGTGRDDSVHGYGLHRSRTGV